MYNRYSVLRNDKCQCKRNRCQQSLSSYESESWKLNEVEQNFTAYDEWIWMKWILHKFQSNSYGQKQPNVIICVQIIVSASHDVRNAFWFFDFLIGLAMSRLNHCDILLETKFSTFQRRRKDSYTSALRQTLMEGHSGNVVGDLNVLKIALYISSQPCSAVSKYVYTAHTAWTS